ncbi:sigma-70 family RNA polymerase sigma factor [Geodermatophilus sp. YIM 151500]|uniref:sigma-70 family RNA polymerase sigma factor n=1 Tax=Geodermatophilus sp. YIM 151500 TaxID=2984531 RepID=UPI0021E35FE0|nr:sigma-70 family RNA polymerase sigma factor [Geodermatophilus sp. YIM 151500]MCV2489483.1 sigma-70 family RNA polymerase sigma factor [Geodermatophilus sp. YIM 151500]
MTAARHLGTEPPARPATGRERPARDRTPSGRPAAAGTRSQREVDALVTEHLPLAAFAVNAVASRIALPAHVSRDDLVSCAHVALVEVARRFDPDAGASFATYALARLQGAVLDELRSGDWASRSVRAAARRTDAAADALAMRLGRPPTREELAESLGMDRGELDALQVDVHRAVMVSIDAETGPDGGSLDLPDGGETPERAVLRGERARYLHDAIRKLPDRLDEVVERNFFGGESLTDIAEDLGVTLSRVSQMRARALTLLHAAMSEVWVGKAVPADGGVRARNQQKAYVDRVAGRTAAPARRPTAPSPGAYAGVRPPARSGWITPGRGPASRPA